MARHWRILCAALCCAMVLLIPPGRAGGAAAPAGAHPPGPRYPAGTVVRLHRRSVAVTIKDFMFHPARLAVSPGTTIVWTNQDSDPHTVDSTTGVWTSPALDTDGTFTRRFLKAGSFSYYCSVHPFMHGLIIVART